MQSKPNFTQPELTQICSEKRKCIVLIDNSCMFNILVLRDQRCVAFLNKINLLQTENLCFHTQQLTCGSAHLLFGHMLYSCCFLVLHGQASLQTYFCYKEKHLPLSFSSHSTQNFHHSSSVFQHKCTFTPTGCGSVLEARLKANGRGPLQHFRVQHLSL